MCIFTRMASNAFKYVTDPHGALRKPDAPAHHVLGDSSLVFRTESRTDFETKIEDEAFRAGVLILPREESDELAKNFNTLLGQRTDKVVIIAKVQPNGEIQYSTERDSQADILQADVMSEIRDMTEIYHRAIPQLTHLEIELGRNITLGLHKHRFPVLNRVVGDSGTGWYTSDIGPDSAGEGNLFFFKGDVSHEATTRGILGDDGEVKLAKPDGRTSIIVHPNTSHFYEVVAEMRAAQS